MRTATKPQAYDMALALGVDPGERVRHDRLSADGPIYRRSIVLVERADPDDLDPRRKEQRKMMAARVACPLREMHRRSGLVTTQHLVAVERLRDAYERGVGGATEGRGDFVAGQGFGAGSYAPEARLAALAVCRHAFRAMGLLGGAAVAYVALGYPQSDRADVASWAARMGMPPQVARGILIGALDALVLQFCPPERAAMDSWLAELVG